MNMTGITVVIIIAAVIVMLKGGDNA